MKIVRIILIGFLTLSLIGCTATKPLEKVERVVVSSPTAWMDGPLDGMTIPLKLYDVVFHIADPAGVIQGELSINNQVVASLPNPDVKNSPVTLHYNWDSACSRSIYSQD